jgi:dihydroorotase-like cyclic amidohydrolase
MKPEASPSFVSAQTPAWLLQTAQQIQAIDYELHATLRIISKGQMNPDHIPAFMEASTKRDRLMARLFSYLAAQRKQSAAHKLAPENGTA